MLSASSAISESLHGVLNMSDVEVFSQNGKFGIRDKNANTVVKPIYKKIIRLGKTSWIVQKNNRFGLMDSSGNYLVQPKYRHVDRYFGTYVKFGNDKDYGLYDETGKIIIPPEYSKIDPMFGKLFLTYKNYKCGIIDSEGKVVLENEFDDIYMPKANILRIRYEGEWYDVERIAQGEITLPQNSKKVTVGDSNIKITRLIADTGIISSYSALTAADYTLKIFSSISPAYEQTIDELMLSQGAETVSIFIKLGWLPKFPVTYVQKYCDILRHPNNGPLSEIRYDVKKQMNK